MKKRNLLLGAAAAGTALYTGLCALLFHEIFHKDATIPGKIFQSSQKKSRDPDEQPKQKDPREVWLHEQDVQDCRIEGVGGHTLTAHYIPAAAESDRWVLCSHGYRSRGMREFRLIAKFYHDAGYHVLMVDHRASGDSEGKFITFGKIESEDLLRWLDWIRTTHNAQARVILHGISMGAATVMMLSDRAEILPNVKFIVADCGYTSVENQFGSVLEGAHIPHRALIGSVSAINRAVSGFPFRDVEPHAHVQHAVVPMLFIHGDADNFVPTRMSIENYEACCTEKALVLINGAAHAESYPTDSATYENAVKQFMDRYMDAEPTAK
ncbi:MAG: alpha/beta hydrolase [Clostridia bacterium]|nr:alpha/beta hydrolase [Clostridia bacterium]